MKLYEQIISRAVAGRFYLSTSEQHGISLILCSLHGGEDITMSMNTNLKGRVRHTKLPKSSGLLPLFEAVINSIHSIEDAHSLADAGRVTVEILRTKQPSLDFPSINNKPGRDAVDDIVGFKIFDNGVGFNDANLESFKTLDSDHKADKGCRGVGRLLWLKAFDDVGIDSIYADGEGGYFKRSFGFSASAGVCRPRNDALQGPAETGACVHLNGFKSVYRDSSRKTADAIAKSLFEHCLWYFVRPSGAPDIFIVDGAEKICLTDVYEGNIHSCSNFESITIKDIRFELTHIKLRSNSAQTHVIGYCASNRLVKEESIKGKVPGLHGRIEDDDGDFVYSCYVTSLYLDENVRSERTGFDISEEDVEGLFADALIPFKDIRGAVIDKASEHLSNYLHENRRKGRERVDYFVSNVAPRYRPILSRIPQDQLIVDPCMSDKELDLFLHKFLAEIERTLLSDGHGIMSPRRNEAFSDYKKRLATYLSTAEDLKKSDLANYVSHRKVILDLLEKAIKVDDNGKYAREELIHELIMPMGTDSTQVAPDNCNLWLINESLAFHNYLASDKTLLSMPITGDTSTKEPDLCALNVFDNPILVAEGSKLPLASLTVIEIKRPMRNDAAAGEDKDPIEQALGYLDRIREGKVLTATGRPIPNSQDIPGFCYILCDLTSSITSRCKLLGLTVTSDHMGYFGYNPNYKAYIEVISFDMLVNAAKQRNRAFFDKLGLPTI